MEISGMNEKDHADVKIHPPVLTLLHLAAGLALGWLLPLPLAPPQILRTFGLAAAFMGFLLGAAALAEFSRNHTTLDPHGTVSKLVTTGIYRFTRNPIYLGFVLMVIGVPLWFENLWGAALTPILIAFFNALVIRHEEAYLEKKFGEAYTGYKSRVRRWL
jgi:protein-S-isoprenylcysteine O-methyltransferase Ste14